jgi:hypothetical protein
MMEFRATVMNRHDAFALVSVDRPITKKSICPSVVDTTFLDVLLLLLVVVS